MLESIAPYLYGKGRIWYRYKEDTLAWNSGETLVNRLEFDDPLEIGTSYIIEDIDDSIINRKKYTKFKKKF